jgi:hypothetical protein
MRPVVFFFAEPEMIAERVAKQLGCSPDEALVLMEQWDRIAVFEHRAGNDIPLRKLN